MMKLPYGSDYTVIGQVLNRSLVVASVDEVILATSTYPENDILKDYVENNFPEVKVFRGSEENVLERFYQASKKNGLDQIIRLTGDNPCIDPDAIEKTLADHLDKKADYTYTKAYPLGMNIEMTSFYALEKAYQESSTIPEKEHVTVFMRNHPELFKLNFPDAQTEYSEWRLTLDTPQDYSLMCIVFEELCKNKPFFSYPDLKAFIKERPYLLDINSGIQQKRALSSQAEEVEEAIQLLQRLDMSKAAKVLSNAK